MNTKKTENENELRDNSDIKTDNKRFDTFEHQKQEKTAGTYHIMKNDDGKLEVVFDGANNISSSESNEISAIDLINKNDKTDKTSTDNKINSKDKKPTIVVTTSDLSAVEREIKELKQQIQAELDRVTKELEKNDTDAYRNSHDNSRQYTLS